MFNGRVADRLQLIVETSMFEGFLSRRMSPVQTELRTLFHLVLQYSMVLTGTRIEYANRECFSLF
jgi:hypothetical protein